MQYMITWNERQQGSPIEYENAQKRILEVFSPWKAPANFKIHSFVIRVGDWGGYMLMECETRSKCISSVQCCLLSHSKLALSSPSPTPFAWNSKRWPTAMD